MKLLSAILKLLMERSTGVAWSLTEAVLFLSFSFLRLTASTFGPALSVELRVFFLLLSLFAFAAFAFGVALSVESKVLRLFDSFFALALSTFGEALSFASSLAVDFLPLNLLTFAEAVLAFLDALSVASSVALTWVLLKACIIFCAFLALAVAFLGSASSVAFASISWNLPRLVLASLVFFLALESSTSSFALLLSAVFLMLSMDALMLSELSPQRSAKALAACPLMPEASACRMIASRASCSTPFARSISPLLKPVLSPCLRIFSAAF